ncbi:hypothetical protein EYF80_031646 [Liparis tanakae]|uniref:Uncharacterized protein n=1 Tax=Liparis tanakae TaxID=230148 RepID=A0A4Z2GZB9_9TELE|nr:hypothetical protein EYF80_031646 [Liparis tanakae]
MLGAASCNISVEKACHRGSCGARLTHWEASVAGGPLMHMQELHGHHYLWFLVRSGFAFGFKYL